MISGCLFVVDFALMIWVTGHFLATYHIPAHVLTPKGDA
jgi:hypothetical protein